MIDKLGRKALVDIFTNAMIANVKGDEPDLTCRQMAVFLRVYSQPGPHTIRGLSALLNVPKPSITRAVDRLVEFDLVRRSIDPADRRSIFIQNTLSGSARYRAFGSVLVDALNAHYRENKVTPVDA